MKKPVLIAGVLLLGVLATACADDGANLPGGQMPGGQMPSGMPSGMMNGGEMDHGGGSSSAPVVVPKGAQRETVRAVEFAFDPDALAVETGRPVAITFENEGSAGHDYTVHNVDGTQVEGGHAYADPGERATLVVTLAPGTYQVWCTIAGHRQAGMEATITAT
ncbi:MAG: cupredoxin domain-containing protein [Actinomycetota bacterium]